MFLNNMCKVVWCISNRPKLDTTQIDKCHKMHRYFWIYLCNGLLGPTITMFNNMDESQ